MSHRHLTSAIFASALAMALVLFAPQPAEAYRLSGRFSRDRIPVPFQINTSRMPYPGLVQQAAQRWSNKPHLFSFRFAYQGASGRWQRGANQVYMDDGRMGRGTLGLCWSTWTGSSLSGFKIALNGRIRFGQVQFLNTVIHEMGHALGLDHSRDHRSVMNAGGGAGDRLTDLHADDIAGARRLYPPRQGNPEVPDDGGPDQSSGQAVDPRLPAQPRPLGPSGSISNARPAFRWTPAAKATHYELALDVVSPGNRRGKLSRVGPIAATTTTAAAALSPGIRYLWWIRAVNQHGRSAWSGPLAFDLAAGDDTPGKPVLLAPLGTIVEAMPEFRWRDVAKADRYELMVQVAGGATILHREYLRVSTHQGQAVFLQDQRYNWWVRAWRGRRAGAWAAGSFIREVSENGPVPDLAPGPNAAYEAQPEAADVAGIDSQTQPRTEAGDTSAIGSDVVADEPGTTRQPARGLLDILKELFSFEGRDR